MLGAIKNFFGKPIRKVRKAAVVSAIVPILVWCDATFEWGLGSEVVSNVGEAIAVLIVSLAPVIAAYSASSDPSDIANIPQ